MPLTQDTGCGDYQIRAYRPGAITVNDTVYQNSLIIAANALVTDWPPQQLSELEASHFDAILALSPEVVILGTGQQFTMPPPQQLAPLYQQGFGVECMDTGAACRTYSALNAENRHVVAALLIH